MKSNLKSYVLKEHIISRRFQKLEFSFFDFIYFAVMFKITRTFFAVTLSGYLILFLC